MFANTPPHPRGWRLRRRLREDDGLAVDRRVVRALHVLPLYWGL